MTNKEISKIVYNYPTKYKECFTDDEVKLLLKKFKNINEEKYNDAMKGNTCMIIDGSVITYHCDLVTAIICGVNNRNQYWYEMD